MWWLLLVVVLGKLLMKRLKKRKDSGWSSKKILKDLFPICTFGLIRNQSFLLGLRCWKNILVLNGDAMS